MPKLKKQSNEERRRLQKLRTISKKKKEEPLSAATRQKKYLQNEENLQKHLARQRIYRSTAEYEEKHRSDERNRLEDSQQRAIHNKIQSQSQKRRLEDPCIREIHNKRNRQTQEKRLEDPCQRLVHNKRQSLTQERRLEDPSSRLAHNERLSQSQKKRLEDPEQSMIHKERRSQADNKRLSVPEVRQSHNERQSLAQQNRLNDPELRSVHNKRQSLAQKKRLSDPELRSSHNERQSLTQKKRLSDPELRSSHNERQSLAQKKRLSDPELRSSHNERQSLAQQKRLSDPELRSTHNERQSQSQRNRLSDQEQHEIHISRVLDSRNAREDRIRRNLYDRFNKLKLEGPIYVCCCCERLNFITSVSLYRMLDIPLSMQYMEANGMIKNNEIYGYLCTTCSRTLKAGRIPVLAMSNEELKFPDISQSVAALSDLEERFVALMIPFMTIRVSIGDQYLVRGRAVNVPTEVQESISILPRLERDTQIIPICFRRKKVLKSNIMFEMVRPKVILDSLLELQNSELYQHFNVKVDLNRMTQISLPHRSTEMHSNEIVTENNDEENDSDASTISDEDEPINVVDDATLLLSEALVFAPGEGKKPVSLFDEYAEAKSFIKIYGGKLIKKPSAISYQNWIKSEIMRSDRRCAHITKLFFSALKLRTSKIATSISFCLRKTKLKKPATVENMLDDNYMENMELHDSGYKVLAVDRGAPAYWEEKKREVFAMIRQLGAPTLFLTLSAAETKWKELIVILKNIVDKQEISLNTAGDLEYKEKARLIKSDPVTCARYFDYLIRQLFNLLKKQNSVFREYTLLDFYTRTEFQQRGSPHCHCLLWLRNSPKINEEDEQQNASVTAFVDRFISCTKDPDLERTGLLEFQTHKHTFTCKKGTKKNKKCRFDIPFFPLKETTILFPLKNMEKNILSTMQQTRQELQDFLTKTIKDNKLVTIDEVLAIFHLPSYENYIDIIRSGIVRPTLMLKRTPEECMINCYNKDILELNCANMDIQFIVDMYSCAAYVLNYLNKSTRGMSKLLRDAASEIRRGNYTMKEQLRLMGNSFLQASEFSAQEAVYYILALPLSKSSRQCVFINTSPPDKRVAVVKSKKLLVNLQRDSEDIYVKNSIDHYIHRPAELENICLASFVAWYTYSSKPNRRLVETSDNDDVDNQEDEEYPGDTFLRLNDDSGYLHLRRKSKIIRYVRYNERQDFEHFRRETVMLFVPWRDETTMITSVAQLFATYGDLISQNRSEFVFNENIDTILQEAILQQNEDLDYREEAHTPRELAVFGNFSQQGDLAVDMMNTSEKPDTNTDQVYIPVPNMLLESEYINIICSLNEKQRIFLTHIIHCFKLGLLPIYHCVLGGAGVGKSRLIQAVCQTLLRLLNKSSTDLESPKVLLCAPTGKAAFGINGTTLHSAFVLPLNQCSAELVPLSSSTRNTVFNNLRDVKLIIIDEISMVGSRTFQQVDCRLKQIFRSPKPFAGISLIVLGDFNQLPPVGDRYIFESYAMDLYGDIIGNPLWRLFTSFTLTEIMRQKDDALFAETLNNLATGNLTSTQIRLLESRVVDQQNDIPSDALRLYRTNADVDIYNKNVIDQDPNKQIVEAQDAVTGKASETTKFRLLNAAKSSALKDTQGLPYKLELSLGIKYMVTVNVDVLDGLVNGAVGILKDFDTNHNGEVTRLWLFFPDQNVGKNRRTQVKKQGHPDWTALDRDKRSFRPTKNLVTLVRHQFPLTPAEAITIYKSQGGTYKKVAVHLKRGLRRTELYVALSRCTTLQGLYLIGKFSPPPAPSPHDKIQLEIKRLGNNQIHVACPFPKDFVNKDSIVYHNVNSLTEKLHWQDTNNFIRQQKPVLFVGAETRTLRNDNVNIEGYKVKLRIDGPNRLPGYGFVVYCRSDKNLHPIYKYHDERHKFFLMAGVYEDVVICAGYRSPSTPYRDVEMHIEECLEMAVKQKNNILFLGDFNIDLNRDPTHAMFAKLTSKGLKSGLPTGTITSDGNTGIDIIFSNFDLFCGVTETLFSDHKQLLCVLDAPQFNTTEQNRPESLPLPIANYNELTLAEAENEGSALYRKLKQQPSLLDEYDTNVIRRLCDFLRRGIHKRNRSSGENMTSAASHFRSFKAIKVTGDGNCFYYAVSTILCGKEKRLMKCLRAVEAAHIISNTEFIQEIETVMGREENDLMTARNVLSNGRYAKIGDVFLLAVILQRPINVYVDDSLEHSYRFAPFHNNEEIHIHLDTRLQHYTALWPIGQVALPPLFDHTLIQTEFVNF